MGGVVYDKVRKNIFFTASLIILFVIVLMFFFYHTFSFIDYPHISKGGPAKNSDLIGHLKGKSLKYLLQKV